MKESKAYQKLKKLLQYKDIMLQPIESGSTGSGIPDVFFRTKRKDGWIELKSIKQFPIRENTPIKIPWRPGQIRWINAYRKLGGNTFLFVFIENSFFVFYGSYIRLYYSQWSFIKLSDYNTLIQDIDPNILMRILNHQ